MNAVNNILAAEAIATALTDGLHHPGNPKRGQQATFINLPQYRIIGPAPYQDGIRESTRLIAESIIHLIETQLDSTIIRNTELTKLRDDNTRLTTQLNTLTAKQGAEP